MKVQVTGETMRISGLRELNEEGANSFRDRVMECFSPSLHHVEVDLSHTMTVDGCGLGALLSLQKECADIRLLNPSPSTLQILELTRMNRVFQIVQNP